MSTTNSELSALTQQQELDSKLGTTTRIPRLTDANDFPEWKWRFEQHLKVKDYKLWRSILRGPREIMMESPTEPEVKVKKPRDQYTEDDLLIVEEDDRALSYLTMGLGPNIAMGFRTCKSAKELWDSLVEVYEGNEDMKESRRNLLQQNFNNFNHIYGETVDNQIQRFVKLVTQMQMEEIHTTNASTNRQLLNALPKSWDHHVAMIKKTKDLARCTLSEMISHIKACELDDKQRETNYKNSMLAAGFSIAPTASSDSNTALLSQGGFQMFRNTKPAPTSANVYNSGSSTQASPASAGKTSAAPSVSVASNEMVAFFSRQSKENLEIAASVINCMNAFASGNLDPPKFSMDDLDQIHPEDVEEMDITWQMAMAAFRAKNFVRKTGKNKWQNLKFTGPVKMPFEYRCYNCHEQGHLARNCTKPKVNDEQTPAQPAAPVTPNRERALVTTTGVPADSVNSGSPQVGLAQALVVQPDSPFDWSSEIERLNISAPENQATPSNIAFMASNASVSDDVKAAQEEESSAENFAFMTQILSAPVKGLTKEEEQLWRTTVRLWYMDSGCSRHMTGDLSQLVNVKEFNGGYVSFAGGESGRITLKGTVQNGVLSFENVNYVPELKHNLLSISQICDRGNSVHFTKKGCHVLKPGIVIPEDWFLMTAERKGNAYVIDMNKKPCEEITCLFSKISEHDGLLWHRRLGHVNMKNLNRLAKGQLVRDLPIKDFMLVEKCVACAKGKAHRKPHKSKPVPSTKAVLELLHMDLFGPVNVLSIGKKAYCLVIVDDYSRYTWVYFLSHKNETAALVKQFITLAENQASTKVKVIRSDNGTEFKNVTLDTFCSEKGIDRQFSAPRTPQQNGVAERRNRTLIEAARTMLADSKLPSFFWAEAVSTACYIQNHALVNKRHMKTPYEILEGHKPSVSHFRIFGCPCV
ncbi:putative RNA-directed DNA polymerase [Helianthus annuus]|nr:putative RNA-directed DNA polymerase [Helianthus annuus]